MENAITLGEFIELFKYLLQNNRRLVDEGELPISYGICGTCGIGKTKSIYTLAKELGMTLIVLNISQLEEVGDLVGMPIKEFETKDGN
jgi:midasin (ATPase involved in ribosome maturation)